MIFSLLMTVCTVSICVGVVKLGLIYLDSYLKLLRSKCFRGPRPLPLVGNGHLFMGTTADIYQTLQELTTKYQSPYILWLGPRISFVLDDAEHIKRILLDPNALEKSYHYDMVRPLLRRGLITAKVSTWKLHRKAIEPLFGRTVLETFAQKMNRHALLTVEKMGMENPGREFNVHHYTLRYTFDSIMDTSMGIECDSLAAKDSGFFDAVTSATDIIVARIVKPWLYPDLIFNLTSLGQTFRKSVDYVYDFIKNAVDNAKSEIAKQLESHPRASLVGRFLTSAQADYKFTDEEIFEEIVTVVGAGHDTSGNLLSLAIFMLARYPNVQDKLYAEVREIYGESNSECLSTTIQDIDRMEYLNRFIKETMRIFPPTPVVGRYLSKEVNLGEYTLPAGSSVIINFTQSHRNEKYWPEPMEFNPDRFLPNHPLGPRHAYAHTPFSAGVRNCIGRKYALLSMKILLVILTSRYIIKTKSVQEPRDLEFKMCLSLKLKDPILISIERRFPEIS